MKAIKLTYADGNTDELLSLLTGNVFHVTTQTAYRQILRSGRIFNNRDGRFRINVSSERNFGRLSGYVCLFDLREADERYIQEILHCYNFLGPSWFGHSFENHQKWELAYLILRPSRYCEIIPYQYVREVRKRTDLWLDAIPHAEVWIKDHIPLEWISTAYLVDIRRQAPAKDSVARSIYDLHRLQNAILNSKSSVKRKRKASN